MILQCIFPCVCAGRGVSAPLRRKKRARSDGEPAFRVLRSLALLRKMGLSTGRVVLVGWLGKECSVGEGEEEVRSEDVSMFRRRYNTNAHADARARERERTWRNRSCRKLESPK